MSGAARSARGPLILGYLTVAVLVGGFGAWAALARIDGAVIAPGRIEVEENRQVIEHQDGGVLAELLVREGQAVAAGDVLLRLDAERMASELAIVEGQLFELMSRRGRLEAERDGLSSPVFDAELEAQAALRPEIAGQIDGQRRLFAARAETLARQTEQLDRRRAQIATQIEGIEAQQAALATQLALIQEEEADQQSLLDRGLAQASRVLALRRERARLEGSLGELTAQKGQAAERITEIELEILRLSASVREQAITQLRDFQSREIELAERRRALLVRLDDLDLRAPVAGTVYGLTVFGPGAVVRPAEPVMYLVPRDRPLVITGQVPAIDVDLVFAGQPVNLRFPAFDMRHTPELRGEVRSVSADAFVDERTGRSWYRAEILPLPGEIDRLGEVDLVPGMPVEAFIRTGERSPLAYLVQPLSSYFTRAFREG